MRKLMTAGLAISAVFTALGEAGAYVDYPWCTITGGGSRQCTFSSREDCVGNSSRGFGSLCMENPYYRGAPQAAVGQAVRAKSSAARQKSPKHTADR
jgi:hypothetical protein